jgi:hypothetical protein
MLDEERKMLSDEQNQKITTIDSGIMDSVIKSRIGTAVATY